jgi:hypothetical protein
MRLQASHPTKSARSRRSEWQLAPPRQAIMIGGAAISAWFAHREVSPGYPGANSRWAAGVPAERAAEPGGPAVADGRAPMGSAWLDPSLACPSPATEATLAAGEWPREANDRGAPGASDCSGPNSRLALLAGVDHAVELARLDAPGWRAASAPAASWPAAGDSPAVVLNGAGPCGPAA